MVTSKSNTPPNIGALGRGPSRGKLVVEWSVVADPRSFRKEEGATPFSSDDAVVKVYMTGTSLHAECPLLTEKVEDTDLARLHERATNLVREQLAVRTGLKWERWLRVEVRQAFSGFRDQSTKGTEIGCNAIWRAVAKDGRIFTVHDTNNVVLELEPELAPDREPDGEKLGFRVSDDHRVTARTYVPDTEQNRAAVEQLQNRLEQLSFALGDLLRPGESAKVLASVPTEPGAPVNLLGWVPRA